MSEEISSLQSRWPKPDAPIEAHLQSLQEGNEIIREQIVHVDDRFVHAYNALSTGEGQDTIVKGIGEAGVGKTVYGDLLMGIDRRVEMNREDGAATLYGYQSPFDPDKYLAGALQGLTGEDRALHLSEVTHLPDTGPIHRLADARSILLDGETVELEGTAMYMTTNFPGSPRVHEEDDAFRSRQAAEILFGDLSKEQAAKIQANRTGHKSARSLLAPILPPLEARRVLHQYVAQEYPETEVNGLFIVSLIDAINETGLVKGINSSDGRNGTSLLNFARAKKLTDRLKDSKILIPDEHAVAAPQTGGIVEVDSIKPLDLARVASLTFAPVTQLSHLGRGRLREALGDRYPTNIEKAIAIRRLLARVALTVAMQEEFRGPDMERDPRDYAREQIKLYTYANTAVAGFDVEDALFNPKTDKDGSQAKSDQPKVDSETKEGAKDNGRKWIRRKNR